MSRETLLGVGLLVYGALYVVGVFAAGVAWHSHYAALCAVLCAGITYLSYFSQITFPEQQRDNKLLVAVSIASGIIAGLFLLVGV